MNNRTKSRVLIVEDDPSVAGVVSALIEGKGFECDIAPDGLEALKLCRNHAYCAIITDVVMPNMNGLQLTRELTKQQLDAPIMIMTGFGGENAAAEAMSAGAAEFIEKPFSPAEFVLRFQKMLQQYDILRITKEKQNEIQKMSTSIIAGIQNDSCENLSRLQRELDEIRAKKNNVRHCP